MPSFRIILVEPEYDINLGHAARVLANFGQREMWLVNPKANPRGFDAIKYAKHGAWLLRKARVVGTLRQAVEDCDFIVGTSGVPVRSKTTLRSPLTLRQFVQRVRERKGRYAVLLGREGIGLTTEEVKLCDLMVTIPTSERYPVLNLSHALAIILYELGRAKRLRRKQALIPAASREEKERLLKTFDAMVDEFSDELRGPQKVKLAFKRVVGRAVVGDLEARALLGLFGRVLDRLKRKSTPSSSQS